MVSIAKEYLDNFEEDKANGTKFYKRIEDGKTYVAKKPRKTDQEDIEIQAASAACHRLFMGCDYVPEPGLVYTKENIRHAYLSEYNPNFVTAAQAIKKAKERHFALVNKTKKINESNLNEAEKAELEQDNDELEKIRENTTARKGSIEYHKEATNKHFLYLFKKKYKVDVEAIVRMLVAAYVFEEADLHYGNWGFDETTGKLQRIDFDQSLWPIVQKYVETRTDNFKISASDVKSFPNLSDASPKHHPLSADYERITDYFNVIFDFESDEFQKLKYKHFLKFILLDRESLEKIIKYYVGEPDTQKEIVEHLLDRIQKMRDVLMKDNKFIDLMIANPQWKQELEQEFKEYNNQVGHDELKIDVAQISQNYNSVFKQAQAQAQAQENAKKLMLTLKLEIETKDWTVLSYQLNPRKIKEKVVPTHVYQQWKAIKEAEDSDDVNWIEVKDKVIALTQRTAKEPAYCHFFRNRRTQAHYAKWSNPEKLTEQLDNSSFKG